MLYNGLISKFIVATSATTVIALSTLPIAVQAGEVANRINHQQARINQGVRSGQLTQGEYNRDETRLRHDENLRNRDLTRNGGHLTTRERAHLNARLNNNSRDIYFTKHNRRDQPGV